MKNIPNRDYLVDETEQLAVNALQKCGVECHRNNIENKTAVDICTENGVKIDVQYSNNYAKYGDLRLDIISVFKPKNVVPHKGYSYNPNKKIIGNFEEKYGCKVCAVGKVLQSGYLDFLLVLFYNDKYTADNPNPDYILLISRDEIINYCRTRVEYLFRRIIINNKQQGFNDVGLNDTHGSAFIPLNVDSLKNNTKCIFDTYDAFLKPNPKVQQYLIGQSTNG